MKPGLRVSAVVVNHESGGVILETVRALTEQTYPLESIVVIDNHSQDGDPQRIQAAFPHVNLITLPENAGLSRARNTGLRQAEAELVLLLDDDLYLAPQALEWMVKAYQETKAAILCPRIIYYPEGDTIQCDGAALHFTGTLVLRNANCPVEQTPAVRSEVNAFIGACLLVDRQTLEDLGGFDESFFFYLEDLELAYRLRSLGFSLCCEPHAVGYHDRGQGTAGLSFRGQGDYPARRAFYVLRHRWLTMCLHYRVRSLVVLFPALCLYETAALGECLRRGWLLEWVRAAYSLMREGRSIWTKRKRWQGARKLEDRQLLTGGPLPLAAGFVRGKRMAGAVTVLEWLLNSYWNWAKRWL